MSALENRVPPLLVAGLIAVLMGLSGTKLPGVELAWTRAPDLRFAGTAPGARRVPRRRTVVSPRSHYSQSITAAAGFGISGGWHLPVQPQPHVLRLRHYPCSLGAGLGLASNPAGRGCFRAVHEPFPDSTRRVGAGSTFRRIIRPLPRTSPPLALSLGGVSHCV